jgi:pectinesterase
MRRRLALLSLPAATVLAVATASTAGPPLRVAVGNDLDLARPGETVELPAAPLSAALGEKDLARVHVAEEGSGRELLAQPVDLDGDGAADQLVFQADFAPRGSRAFVLTVGAPRAWTKQDFRVYGRFVRERFDDFAWENDRVAHRMYGAALEGWEKEPLTSSTVDVWCKRTRRLVINDWYMVDDYHRDTGEGADFYSAGASRGCGGSGIWRDGRLYVSRNFRGSRVLANGPIRLVFELLYEPWDAGGVKVSETKRVTLDAGRNLSRFESHYHAEGGGPLGWAAGIKRPEGANWRVDREAAWLRMEERLKDGNGTLWCGIVLDPKALVEVVEANGNEMLVGRPVSGEPAAYLAGFGWDRSGDFTDVAAWERYLGEAARRLRSPLRVELPAP